MTFFNLRKNKPSKPIDVEEIEDAINRNFGGDLFTVPSIHATGKGEPIIMNLHSEKVELEQRISFVKNLIADAEEKITHEAERYNAWLTDRRDELADYKLILEAAEVNLGILLRGPLKDPDSEAPPLKRRPLFKDPIDGSEPPQS